MKICLNDKVLFSKAKVANNILTRFKGLMLRSSLNEGEALIITPCNSIHMFFMRMPLDVLFVNNKNEVVAIVENIKPWRMTKMYWDADYVVECPIGTVSKYNIEKGNVLILKENEVPS